MKNVSAETVLEIERHRELSGPEALVQVVNMIRNYVIALLHHSSKTAALPASRPVAEYPCPFPGPYR